MYIETKHLLLKQAPPPRSSKENFLAGGGCEAAV